MSRTPTQIPAPAGPVRPWWNAPSAVWLGGLIIVLAGGLAYANSLTGPLVFDDSGSISDNPTIRDLWALVKVLRPPANETVAGRPLVNLSLAINYALGGTAVLGYHATNLAIHLLAGLTLFGLVRRTLLRPALAAKFADAALPLALTVALLWTLHPLQTEAVTYVVQRAESLMGLCYLLTLYAFVRSLEGAGRRFRTLAVLACLAGMACKEVMVSAPLLVLFYDRTFGAGSFRVAWRERRGFYLALGATWLLLAGLVVSAGNRADTAGFATAVSAWDYARTQAVAVVQYLALVGWPHPLVFDYGTGVVTQAGQVIPSAAALSVLAAGTVWALVRRPALGFCGLWFFAILAPSSSVVPVATQTMAEHRMYLPLAALSVLWSVGLYHWMGGRSLPLLLVLAAGLGALTTRRNADYTSALALWSDTVRHEPGNARAHNNLGVALSEAGRPAEAFAEFQRTLDLQDTYVEGQLNYGNALLKAGRTAEAISHYEVARRLDPRKAETANNLGYARLQSGRPAEAVADFEAALALRPDYAEADSNLGVALTQTGRAAEALARFKAARNLKPDYAEAVYNEGLALCQLGRTEEGGRDFAEALYLNPDYAEAHNNLGNLLAAAGRLAEALPHFVRAVTLQPGAAGNHYNLGLALLGLGRPQEAVPHFEQALKLQPDFAAARQQLATALQASGK